MVMYKFSGHETFSCRYTWLPKAFRALEGNPSLFSDLDHAMVTLGVGKNMVRSIRFWAELAGICKMVPGKGYFPTPQGDAIFGSHGFDPYLEDRQTLWLIHWKFTTHLHPPFAWDYLFNRWQAPDFTVSSSVNAFEMESKALGKSLSPVTLKQHFDIFRNTYYPVRGAKGAIAEENLDCPLTELELIQYMGERRNRFDKSEKVFAFRRDEKPDISPQLFVHCLADFWKLRHPEEKTLSFREVAVGHGSPGQIFKMPESEIRHRLDLLKIHSHGVLDYRETANLQQVSKDREIDELFTLREVYENQHAFA